MELGNIHPHGIDLQTEMMLPIHTDIVCRTLDTTDTTQEPEFHTDSGGTNPCENAKYSVVCDVANTFNVKTEVIDDDYNHGIDRYYNHEVCSNSSYIDTGMIRDIRMDPVKSEPLDEPLETNARNEFIIETDTCKDEYYEKHGYPNRYATVHLGNNGVDQRSGRDCVTKEDLYLKHIDTQHKGWAAPYTSVDITQCSVVLHDIHYSYPKILTQGYVRVHHKEPTIQIRVQQSKHKPYQCSVCGVGFAHKKNMTTHMLIHTGEKPHKCTVCERSFASKSNLASHMRTHTGEKPHKYSVCGVGFAHGCGLKYHTTIHTGEKPYTCTICGVDFSQKSNLTSHQRIHTGEKPHMCSVCGAEFTYKHYLNAHMRIHNGEKPHKCSVCEVSFSQKGNLVSHMRKHTGDTPYKCLICGIGFGWKSYLKTHTLIHTGEKPHTCYVCEVSFTHRYSLTQHMRTHT